MVPCTEAASLCEIATVLAPAGTCDVGTGLCVCEEGYSGVDDWQAYNSCHVNERVQRAMWTSALVLLSVAFVFGISAIHHLYQHWGWEAPWCLRVLRLCSTKTTVDSSSSSSSSSSSVGRGEVNDSMRPVEGSLESGTGNGVLSTPHQSRATRARANRTLWRQRYTMATVIAVVVACMSLMTSFAYNLSGQFRFEADAGVQNFAFAIGAALIFCCFWGLFFIYFLGLPSIRHFGKLFGVQSVLITWPNTVRVTIAFRLVAIFFSILVIVWIIPLTIVDDDDVVAKRSKLDDAMLVVFFVVTTEFYIFTLVLCRILWRLYSQLLTLSLELRSSNPGSAGDAENFRRARKTIVILVILICTVGAGGPIMQGVILASSEVRRHAYVAANVYILLGAFSLTPGVYLLSRRLSGPAKSQPTPKGSFESVTSLSAGDPSKARTTTSPIDETF